MSYELFGCSAARLLGVAAAVRRARRHNRLGRMNNGALQSVQPGCTSKRHLARVLIVDVPSEIPPLGASALCWSCNKQPPEIESPTPHHKSQCSAPPPPRDRHR